MNCPKKGNKLPCAASLNRDDLTLRFADALRRATVGLLAAAKVIAVVAGVSERTAKNWLAGRCAPQHPAELALLAAAFVEVRDVIFGAITDAERDVQVRRITDVRNRNARTRAQYEERMNVDMANQPPAGRGDFGASDVSAVDSGVGDYQRLGRVVAPAHSRPWV